MNDNNNNKETEMLDGADYIRALEMKIIKLEEEVTQLTKAREDYRNLYNTSVEGVRSNVGRIGEVLHSYAKDCDMKDEITEIIEKINDASTDSRFPRIEELTEEFEITVTYVIRCDAKDEDDALKRFKDGDFDDRMDEYEMSDDTRVEKAC